MKKIILEKLKQDDKEQFILDNQEAFNFGAMQNLNSSDTSLKDNEIISRDTIEKSIKEGAAFRIISDGKKVGGVVVKVSQEIGDLELLFVLPKFHNKGIGQQAWKEVEKLFPNVKIWKTVTPYFEKRNIYFYVNKCGFHIVEIYKEQNQDKNGESDNDFPEEMFRFEKRI